MSLPTGVVMPELGRVIFLMSADGLAAVPESSDVRRGEAFVDIEALVLVLMIGGAIGAVSILAIIALVGSDRDGRSPALRWQGLTLLTLAVFKVFVFDLSFLERAYRILSFLALGLLLLVVSFLYQRKLFCEPSRS